MNWKDLRPGDCYAEDEIVFLCLSCPKEKVRRSCYGNPRYLDNEYHWYVLNSKTLQVEEQFSFDEPIKFSSHINLFPVNR